MHMYKFFSKFARENRSGCGPSRLCSGKSNKKNIKSTMKHLLLGDEAIALGAIDAGLSGVYAYPGTPSTEITEYIQLAESQKSKVKSCELRYFYMACDAQGIEADVRPTAVYVCLGGRDAPLHLFLYHADEARECGENANGSGRPGPDCHLTQVVSRDAGHSIRGYMPHYILLFRGARSDAARTHIWYLRHS